MTDETPPEAEAEGIDPQRIRDAFTARELGLWEMTVNASLEEFGSSYLLAMLAWWGAHQDGDKRPPDAFLDMNLTTLTSYAERASDLLGKQATGDGQHSGMSTDADTGSLPSSPISTTSPSPSSLALPG